MSRKTIRYSLVQKMSKIDQFELKSHDLRFEAK